MWSFRLPLVFPVGPEVEVHVLFPVYPSTLTDRQNRLVMRPSSLGRGRILRRTMSVCLSVCLSVRPVIVAMGDVFSAPLASRRAT